MRPGLDWVVQSGGVRVVRGLRVQVRAVQARAAEMSGILVESREYSRCVHTSPVVRPSCALLA
jgi:hypothetical protein